jgi:hypothetical protein
MNKSIVLSDSTLVFDESGVAVINSEGDLTDDSSFLDGVTVESVFRAISLGERSHRNGQVVETRRLLHCLVNVTEVCICISLFVSLIVFCIFRERVVDLFENFQLKHILCFNKEFM